MIGFDCPHHDWVLGLLMKLPQVQRVEDERKRLQSRPSRKKSRRKEVRAVRGDGGNERDPPPPTQ